MVADTSSGSSAWLTVVVVLMYLAQGFRPVGGLGGRVAGDGG